MSSTLAYGFAAFNSATCGDCYELTFTGAGNSNASDPGSAAICGQKMVVQVVNTGGLQANQFDIMVPGGGVGDFNACASEWGTTNLGQQYGGFLLSCEQQSSNYATYKACAKNWCSTVFKGSDKAELLAGCNWLVDWLQAADNPKIKYTKVACPAELTAKAAP